MSKIILINEIIPKAYLEYSYKIWPKQLLHRHYILNADRSACADRSVSACTDQSVSISISISISISVSNR